MQVNRPAFIAAIFGSALLLLSLVHPNAARADVSDVFDTAIGTLSAGFDYIWPDDIPIEDFSLRLGVGIGTTPDYPGSDEYRLRVIPLINLRYKDVVALQGNRLSVNFIRYKNVKAGPLLNLRFGREEKRNAILTGLGDVADTVLAGAFIEGRYKGLFASAEYRQALGAGQGATMRFVLAQGLYRSASKKTTMIAAIRSDWNSARSNQTNFGITPAQSLASGLTVYAPGGGFSKIELDILGRHQLGENWRLDWVAGYARIIGDPADSPLVAVFGSANQFIIGLGTQYSF